jgi:diguanylate cyclase (GGDEF)-like protein/PAS domain S-box-containing protein
MKTKPIKNKIMVLTTFIFAFLTLFFNLYLYYTKTKEHERDYLEKEKNIQNIISHIQEHLAYTVSSRLETITKLDYFKDFKQDLANNEFRYRTLHIDRLRFNYENIKQQVPHIETLHIIDPRGYSYIRLHNTNLYRDKVADLRSSILQSIKNPKNRHFYEHGLFGLKYRVSHPIFEGEQFVGLLEVGINPAFLSDFIQKLTSLESFVLIKEKDSKNYAAQTMLENTLVAMLQDDTTSNIEYDGKIFLKYAHTLYDMQGSPALKIVTIEDVTDSRKVFINFVLLSILTSITLMFLLLWILDRFFTKIFLRIDELLYLINHTQDFIIAIDAATKKIKFANTPTYQILGLSRKELKASEIADILLPAPEDAKNSSPLFERSSKALTKRALLACTKEHHIPLEMSINYIPKDGGYFVVIARNISEQLELELQKKVNERMINKYIPMSHTDLNGVITYVNEAFCNLTGYSKEELLGHNHSLLKSPKTPASLYKNMWESITADKTFRTELRVVTKEKEEIWVKILIEPRYDISGKKTGYISTREDVTDKQKLKFISEHDTLTKAYNRRSFESKLAQMLEDALKHDRTFGVVMFDIDHFKKVNDTYGHQVGDDVLVQVSHIVKDTLREEDFFARWGGEEFMLILKNSKIEELTFVVAKIQEHLKSADFTPVPRITSSFGVTLYKPEDTKESILKRVDEALYRAKALGRDRYEIG